MTQVTHRPLLKATLISIPSKSSSLIADTNYLQILLSNNQQRFDQRQTLSRFLVSEPFQLLPGEAAFIVIQYKTIGATYLNLNVQQEATWQANTQRDWVYSTGFYVCSLTLLLLFGLFGIAVADRTVLSYSGLFALGLLWVATLDGLAFQFLWPWFPNWNHWASYLLLYLFTALNFWLVFCVSKRRGLIWAGLLTLIIGFGVLLLPLSWMANVGGLLLLLSFAAQLWLFVSQLKSDDRQGRGAVILLVGLSLGLLCMLLAQLFQVAFPSWVYVHSPRLVYGVCSLVTMLLILIRVLHMRRDNEAALEQALRSAQQEARLQRSLVEAEQNYQRVAQLANQRRLQFTIWVRR